MIHACRYCHLVTQSCLTCLQPHRLLACQALLSMEFSRQEYRNRLPFPPPGRNKVVLTPVPSHEDPVSTQELECHRLENLLANLDQTVPNLEPLSGHKEQPWRNPIGAAHKGSFPLKHHCAGQLWNLLGGGSQESGAQEAPPSSI